MDEPKEIYPGHAEEVRQREELKGRLDRAHAAVLPGALRQAFAGDPVMVKLPEGEQKLQPVTLGLTANLERIQSPLLDVVRIMREVFSQKKEAAHSDGGDPPAEKSPRDPKDLFQEINERVKALKFDEESIAETIFIFVRPAKRVRQLLEKGRAPFRETAMEEIGDKLHPTEITALQHACVQHYVASFATIVGYGAAPPPDGGSEMSFKAPSAGGPTGSAGG